MGELPGEAGGPDEARGSRRHQETDHRGIQAAKDKEGEGRCGLRLNRPSTPGSPDTRKYRCTRSTPRRSAPARMGRCAGKRHANGNLNHHRRQREEKLAAKSLRGTAALLWLALIAKRGHPLRDQQFARGASMPQPA